MTLQFQPLPVQESVPEKMARLSQTMQGVGQTFNNMGQQALAYRQQQIENQRQQALARLSGAGFKEQYGYDPMQGQTAPPEQQGPQPSASLQFGTPGPQPNATDVSTGTAAYFPPGSMTPQQPQMPSMSIDHTASFNAWKAAGQPMSWQHPEMQAPTNNPMMGGPQSGTDIYNTMRGIPGTKNQEIFLKAQDEARKQQESNMKWGTGAGGMYYSPDQVRALAPGDRAEKIIQAYGGGNVPKDAVHQMLGMNRIDITQGTKESQFTQKRLTALGDALDPNKQRQGTFGVSKQVFDRAERLETLANAFQDGNLDRRQIEELAIGLNSMLQGGNVGAMEQVRALVPQTAIGNANKFVEWLTNEPRGLAQQQFVQRMVGTVQREKATAADQIKRTQFQRIGRYADLERSNPDEFYNVLQSSGIEPDEYRQWKSGGYKPMSAVQRPDAQGGGMQFQHTATGPNGQKVGWDGQKWVPIQ